MAVVPLLDMANHAAVAPSVRSMCDFDGCWLEATRDLPAGAELTLSCAPPPPGTHTPTHPHTSARARARTHTHTEALSPHR